MDAPTPRGTGRRLTLALGISVLAVALIVPGVNAATPKTKLVSQSGGTQADDHSYVGDISSTGQFVAFATDADNLDGADNNGFRDIYIRNMKTGSTKIVSRSSKGTRTNGDSFRPSISAGGRYIAFDSDADFLIDGKKIAGRQVYLRDRKTGKTTLISVNSAEQVANNQSTSPRLSADGRFVVFNSHGSNLNPKSAAGGSHIYLRDRAQGKTWLISKNNQGKAGIQGGVPGGSSEPDISPDGKRIVYSSVADNLVKADDNGRQQIYLFNRDTGKTSLISKNKNGKAGMGGDSGRASVSTKANVIVFHSGAGNLVWPDKNGKSDIFRRAKGKLSIVSRNWKGQRANGESAYPDVTPNGRYLVFYSYARNMVKAGANGTDAQIYMRDLQTGKVVVVSKTKSKGNGTTWISKISANGKYVIMESAATNLVPGGDANNAKKDVLRRGPLR